MNKRIDVNEEARYAELQMMALDFAREGKTKDLEAMLSHGMNINLQTHKDDTLLMLSSYNGYLETTKMLIAYGADLNQKNQRGQTPLEGVCFKGNLGMVKLLVENNANVEGSAIIYASMFGNVEIVNYLEERSKNMKVSRILGFKATSIVAITSKIRNVIT